MCSTEQYAGNYEMQFCPVILDKPGFIFLFHIFYIFQGGGASAPLPMPVGAHELNIHTKFKVFQFNTIALHLADITRLNKTKMCC